MESLPPRLQALVERLDDLGPDSTRAGIARVLSAAALADADVAPFVRPNPASYHRDRAVRRERYELLVMTCLPGQASPPHDHTGSVRVRQVIRGTAVEAGYTVAADGYADLENESPVATGRVSGGTGRSRTCGGSPPDRSRRPGGSNRACRRWPSSAAGSAG